jgi:hypothetical protein
MPAKDAQHPSIHLGQLKYVYSSINTAGQYYYRCSKRRPTQKRPDGCPAALVVDPDGNIDLGYESLPHVCRPVSDSAGATVYNATEEVTARDSKVCMHLPILTCFG